MRRLLLTGGLVLPLLAAAAPGGGPPASIEDQLLQADRDFAAATDQRGLEGWLSFMADDVVRLPAMGEAGVAGKAAVGRLDASLFADPARRLRWQPAHAGAFLDGRHGYTTGRYQVVRLDATAAEEVLGTGTYLTWWRLDEGGAWRVILDTGAPDPQPAK